MPRNLQLVMFDFDGTLVDSQHVIVAAMSAAFRHAGLAEPPPAAVRRVVGLPLETAVGLLMAGAEAATVAEVAAGYRDAFMVLRREPDFHEPLFPGVREVLDTLNSPETLLGIATGKNRRGLLHSLERHGLAECFVTLKTADDGPGKPHPEILERAMAEVGVGPEETAMVGDTVFDIQMARSARTRAVGVSWGYHDTEDLVAAGAHCIIDGFEDLVPALEAMETTDSQ